MNRSDKGSRAIGRLLVVAGVAAAVGAGAWLVRTHVTASAATAGSGSGAASSGARAGEQRRWAATLSVRMKEGGQGGRETSMVLAGEWVTTISGESAAGTDVACELQGAHAEGTGFGQASADQMAQLKRLLARRIWITYQPDGAAIRAHFPKDMTEDVRNFLELVATQTQLVRPAAPSPQWVVTERDGAGSYLAAYQDGGPGAILKRKMRYLTTDGAGGPAGVIGVRIDSSETRFALDGAGRVNEVDGREVTHVDANLGGQGLGIELRIHLGEPRSAAAPDLAGSFERARADVDSQAIATQRASDEELQRRHDDQLIVGADLQQLLARQLDAAHAGTPDMKAAAQLEAMLRRQPGDIPSAVAFVRDAGKDAAAAVLSALGAAGTPPAQEALCSLASGDDPAPLRAAAVTALVRTKHVTAATTATLLRLLDASDPQVRRQALYMTGTAGQNVHDTDPGAAARIEADLVGRHARCTGSECVDTLVALGNLASPAILPGVQRSLADPSAAVRAAAVRALRKVEGPTVDGLIGITMTDDSDPSVRAAAVFAATFRTIGPLVEPLAHVVRADPIDYVRTDAIEAAANHLDEAPLLEAALQDAAAKDPKPGVQRLAREVLGSRLPR
jgi:HEAT repeat protein